MSERDDPRERARKRLTQMRDAAAFAAAATLGACGGSPDKGYGVVDPLPPPYVCPTPDELMFEVMSASWRNGTIVLDWRFEARSPGASFLSSMVAASGGVSADSNGDTVLLETEGEWPRTVDVTFRYQCSLASGAAATFTYVVRLTLGAVHEGEVRWERITAGDEDAGR